MRFWYDTEFLEDGRTIDLISFGIVAEDGREYYAVNADAPWARIQDHTWLKDNVVPHLPQVRGAMNPPRHNSSAARLGIDLTHPDCKPKEILAHEVRRFLTQHNGPVELWGYYSAYDHVVLAQLFGPMIKLPAGLPMWTNDIQQAYMQSGCRTDLPRQLGAAHNALEDARWTRDAWRYVHDVNYRAEVHFREGRTACIGCLGFTHYENCPQWVMPL